MTENHLYNMNIGGAMAVFLDTNFSYGYVHLTNVRSSSNNNNITLGSKGIGNYGGFMAMFSSQTPIPGISPTTMTSSALTVTAENCNFTENSNVLNNADGSNHGAAFALLEYAFTTLIIENSIVQYPKTYPVDSIVFIPTVTFPNSSLCKNDGAVNVQLENFTWTNNRCDLPCVAGFENTNWTCVPIPPGSGSNLSVGECAGIGIGVGLGMLIVVVLLVLWSRWLLKRSQREYAVEKKDLTERLISTEMEGKNTLCECFWSVLLPF